MAVEDLKPGLLLMRPRPDRGRFSVRVITLDGRAELFPDANLRCLETGHQASKT